MTEKIIDSEETIADNTGMIDNNAGMIDNNAGMIDANTGMIDNNAGLINGNKERISEKIPKRKKRSRERGPDRKPRKYDSNTLRNLKQYQNNYSDEKSADTNYRMWFFFGIVAVLLIIVIWKIYQLRNDDESWLETTKIWYALLMVYFIELFWKE